jgi:hypothetical protein
MNLFFLKKRAVVVVLGLVAVAGIVAGREKPTVEIIEHKAARIETAAVVEADIDLEKLHRGEASAPANDPFARRSFAPAQPVVASAAPASPTVPPLPFRYFGRLTQDGKTEVYVMRGDDLISIAAGQKIDAEYRVERIGDTSIGFTYLPLKTAQSLDLPV